MFSHVTHIVPSFIPAVCYSLSQCW